MIKHLNPTYIKYKPHILKISIGYCNQFLNTWCLGQKLIERENTVPRVKVHTFYKNVFHSSRV